MPTLTDKRILVAGGTGNVGRHLVDAVLAAGGTAIVPARSSEKLAAVMTSTAPSTVGSSRSRAT